MNKVNIDVVPLDCHFFIGPSCAHTVSLDDFFKPLRLNLSKTMEMAPLLLTSRYSQGKNHKITRGLGSKIA
jgi:hypothetical protein